ncbi:MAG: UvrD-helicase domain-containing protein [Lachnospiraceae bacterium]|nr:UvrD-helicase domain-containing protein [Lachnospiraceae bacterium]
MAVKFTPDQQRVIDTRNCNILVSAAAGSGKTAVLVERIIQMITDERQPVDIDRLLIVTFTSAAAAQMRERISRAVAQKLEENPESEHLQRQASLIHNAQITTIDSFCLFVIRNNFNEIGLDPAFRVADESEIKMLEADVMGRLLEEAHTEPTERFLQFVECYSTGTNENKIEEAILRLYHFSMSYPFPEQWLTERLEDYKVEDVSAFSGKKWFQCALAYIRTILQECRDRLCQALEITGSVGGPIQYAENLTADIELVERLQCASGYHELYDLFTYSSFTRLSAKKGENVDPVLKDMVKAIREEVKKNIADLKKFLFQISVEDTLGDMAACQEAVEELVSLTLAFKRMLDQSKRDKNVIDFSDMEHFALQILLRVDADKNVVPSNTALELQDYFAEIMIDEYQDSNEVQELLLKCISGEDKGRFNRFMVGDVKQSIYKFRL